MPYIYILMAFWSIDNWTGWCMGLLSGLCVGVCVSQWRHDCSRNGLSVSRCVSPDKTSILWLFMAHQVSCYLPQFHSHRTDTKCQTCFQYSSAGVSVTASLMQISCCLRETGRTGLEKRWERELEIAAGVSENRRQHTSLTWSSGTKADSLNCAHEWGWDAMLYIVIVNWMLSDMKDSLMYILWELHLFLTVNIMDPTQQMWSHFTVYDETNDCVQAY